jgi:hypothetical protein
LTATVAPSVAMDLIAVAVALAAFIALYGLIELVDRI